MMTGNIIKHLHFVGHGWDFELSIRSVDEQAYNEAKTYIRDVLAGGAEKARQDFLVRLREVNKGSDV